MILIIGAGLSGLLTAYRLKKVGIPFKIVEARNRPGGRIHTVTLNSSTPLEMGATWFTDQHTYIKKLLAELQIDYFEQHIEKTVFYEQSSQTKAQIVQIPDQSKSYRIKGGTSQLIHRLLQDIEPSDIVFNQTVEKIVLKDHFIEVIANDVFECDQLILALPPKMWSKKITFEPQLSSKLSTIANLTQTWMEDSIKVALSYENPFWVEENIPSTLFSNVGPITEFYNHNNAEQSKFALCGFVNAGFKNFNAEERKQQILKQLSSIFGKKAKNYTSYSECVWAQEKHTHTASEKFLFPHQNNGNPIFKNSIFKDKIIICGSESSPISPGYMDGAVFSATMTVKKIMSEKSY